MLAIRNGQVSIVPALVAACNAANLNVQDKVRSDCMKLCHC